MAPGAGAALPRLRALTTHFHPSPQPPRPQPAAAAAPQKFRAAIIGLGYIGGADQPSGDAIGGQQVDSLDGTHFACFTNHPAVELIAGSSRNQGRRERFEARAGGGVTTYADWEEMLAAEKPDIVGVATYTPQHAEMTIACARQGVKAVLCEKPVASFLSEGEAM
eukprot:COSAG06_NODE_21415_length_757_cov_2.393617_1_plen_164_part_01